MKHALEHRTFLISFTLFFTKNLQWDYERFISFILYYMQFQLTSQDQFLVDNLR